MKKKKLRIAGDVFEVISFVKNIKDDEQQFVITCKSKNPNYEHIPGSYCTLDSVKSELKLSFMQYLKYSDNSYKYLAICTSIVETVMDDITEKTPLASNLRKFNHIRLDNDI